MNCAQCGKPLAGRADRKFKGDSGVRLAADIWRAHLEADSFCSTACCRAYHECSTDVAAPRCVDCKRELSRRRNSLAGPRCRDCGHRARQQRNFYDQRACSTCGCSISQNTLGCATCSDRHRHRRYRAAAKNAPVGQWAGSIEPPENGSPPDGARFALSTREAATAAEEAA